MSARRSGNPAVRAQAAKRTPTGRTADGTYSVARYRAEAKGTPFPLETLDGRVIEIPRPTGDRMMELAEKYSAATEAPPHPREQLQDLLGEKYDEVMAVLGGEDFEVLIMFLRDLSEHFGLGEALASFA